MKTIAQTRITGLIVLPILALTVSGCGETWGQRAATGGAIGAGTGLAVGALAGWPLIGPALAGGIIGAGIGAATSPEVSGSK